MKKVKNYLLDEPLLDQYIFNNSINLKWYRQIKFGSNRDIHFPTDKKNNYYVYKTVTYHTLIN